MDSNFGQKQPDITHASAGDPRVASINSHLEVFDSFFSQARGPVFIEQLGAALLYGAITPELCCAQ